MSNIHKFMLFLTFAALLTVGAIYFLMDKNNVELEAEIIETDETQGSE